MMYIDFKNYLKSFAFSGLPISWNQSLSYADGISRELDTENPYDPTIWPEEANFKIKRYGHNDLPRSDNTTNQLINKRGEPYSNQFSSFNTYSEWHNLIQGNVYLKDFIDIGYEGSDDKLLKAEKNIDPYGDHIAGTPIKKYTIDKYLTFSDGVSSFSNNFHNWGKYEYRKTYDNSRRWKT